MEDLPVFPFGNLYFPGAGGNWQEFTARLLSPNITMNFAGNAAIEREVNEDVASYGRQIGWLSDIVAALASAMPDEIANVPSAADSLAKLEAAKEKIAAIKERRKTNALDSARDALRQLGQSDRDAYRLLVRSLDPDRPPAAD
jgi:predicted acylesterase/phospholipase RssA